MAAVAGTVPVTVTFSPDIAMLLAICHDMSERACNSNVEHSRGGTFAGHEASMVINVAAGITVTDTSA